jgi:hypothetical protein
VFFLWTGFALLGKKVHGSVSFMAGDGSVPHKCEGDYSPRLHWALAHEFAKGCIRVSFKVVHRYLG